MSSLSQVGRSTATNKTDRVSLCTLYFLGWPPLPHPSCPQQRPFLLLPRPKRSPRPGCPNARQRPGLLLLRRLPLRLRSQHRIGAPHPRRAPRRRKTQSRSHRRLPGPNSHAVHPHLPARVLRGLRHRRLAPIHPQLRQRQHRLPLPARPRTRTTRHQRSRFRTIRISPTSTPAHPSARELSFRRCSSGLQA